MNRGTRMDTAGTAGFVFGAIISIIIMFGTVMAAYANLVSVPGAWIL